MLPNILLLDTRILNWNYVAWVDYHDEGATIYLHNDTEIDLDKEEADELKRALR